MNLLPCMNLTNRDVMGNHEGCPDILTGALETTTMNKTISSKPNRRSIRIPGYDYARVGAYYVTMVTAGRECIFGDVNGRGGAVIDRSAKLPGGHGNSCPVVSPRSCWMNTSSCRTISTGLLFYRIVQASRALRNPNGNPSVGDSPTNMGTARRAPTTERFGKPVAGSIPTIIRSYKSAVTKQFNEIMNQPGAVVWHRNYYEHIIRDQAGSRPDHCIHPGEPSQLGKGRRKPMTGMTEAEVENAMLEMFADLGYQVNSGLEIAPEEPAAERSNFQEVVLARRLKDALQRLNPEISPEALEDAYRKITITDAPSMLENNRLFHKMLVDGITVETRMRDGSIRGAQVKVIDFENPTQNDWLAVNQFTVIENRHNRRADVVVFVNGLPLAVVELKNPADESADIWAAYKQLQTYKEEIPSLFLYNETLVITDGTNARIGTLTANKEWFLPWKTVDGSSLAQDTDLAMEIMVNGIFEKTRFLDLIKYFVLFEDHGGGVIIKRLSGYHQYHAVNMAVEETIRASITTAGHGVSERRSGYRVQSNPDGKPGDRRVGVVWHTQGAGKSLSMVFYAGKIILHPEMRNPTLVVLTDRNDLDDQLFGTFSLCKDLLRQPPEQAESRAHLRQILQVASGGVVFTTIQKFLETDFSVNGPNGFSYAGSQAGDGALSTRENIVVIADEAHRSQYDFIDGYARHMRDALPNASFIGFTGTPIERTDASTRAVFGDYISVYDIQQAVADGATVPIYYEGRLAKLNLEESVKPLLDDEFEEITEAEEDEKKEKLKSKWAALEAVVGV